MKLDLYGWFPKENEELLAKLIKEHNVKTVLEIGCFLGKSTKFFVEQGCMVTSVDTFEGSKDLNGSAEVKKRLPTLFKQFLFNLRALGIRDKVGVFKGTSAYASEFLHDDYDLVFIDGSHLEADVTQDIRLWNPRAKKIICGDDYSLCHPGVRWAVDQELPLANTDQRLWYLIKDYEN